jgi:hypothetical protein
VDFPWEPVSAHLNISHAVLPLENTVLPLETTGFMVKGQHTSARRSANVPSGKTEVPSSAR